MEKEIKSVEKSSKSEENMKIMIRGLNGEIERQKEEKQYISDSLKEKEASNRKMANDILEKNSKIEELSRGKKEIEEKYKDLLEKSKYAQNILSRRVKEVNDILFAYTSLIKSIQGAVETNSLLSEKIIGEVGKE